MSNYKTHAIISKNDKVTFGKIEHAFQMKVIIAKTTTA